MKLTTILGSALAFAGLAGLASGPAAARTNWQGEVMFTAVSDACAADGWTVGTHGLGLLLPAFVSDNGNNSYFTLHIGRRTAYALKVSGELAAGKAYTAVGLNSAGANYNFAGSFTQYKQSPIPPNVSTSTSFITVKGRITNWASVANCVVDFEGAFVLRR